MTQLDEHNEELLQIREKEQKQEQEHEQEHGTENTDTENFTFFW